MTDFIIVSISVIISDTVSEIANVSTWLLLMLLL